MIRWYYRILRFFGHRRAYGWSKVEVVVVNDRHMIAYQTYIHPGPADLFVSHYEFFGVRRDFEPIEVRPGDVINFKLNLYPLDNPA